MLKKVKKPNSSNYAEFLRNKSQFASGSGFKPIEMPDFLFDFQKILVDWSLRRGRAAIFADCLAGETVIHSPDGDILMREAARRGKSMRVFTREGIQNATSPWVNGFGALFEVVTRSGKSIKASAGHRLLTVNGWRRVDVLSEGDCLLVFDAFRHRSSSDVCRLTHAEGGQNLRRTIRDLQSDYHPFFYCDDAQLLSPLKDDQWRAPLPSDVRAHSLSLGRSDDSVHKYTHTHPYQRNDRHSMTDLLPASGMYCATGEVYPSASLTPTLPSNCAQRLGQYPAFSFRSRQARELSESSEGQMSTGDQFSYCDTITAIRYVRHDYLFDIHVPNSHHFLANGFWAHNCGLGKTPISLVWAQNVFRKTGLPVLILTPLAVSHQFVREGKKFEIGVKKSDGRIINKPVTVTNYEQLHHFRSSDWGGVVCDESSILKNFSGKTRKAITEFLRTVQYRLLCTATAAPNDFIEFGTSSEALGELGYIDILARFFKHDTGSSHPNHGMFSRGNWRFRGHAEQEFWRWLCSWSRAVRRPSDLGCKDDGFTLPELNLRQHIVNALTKADGMLFDLPAHTLHEQRDERRRTIQERCEKAADIANRESKSLVVWCNLNDESKLLTALIPDSEEVAGGDSDEKKETTFQDFESGNLRVLVTKATIAGFGLNWQHCAHQTFFPSHSFEQFYQAIRRSWRFGQKKPVAVDVITSEGEARVLANLQRKQVAAEKAFTRLVELMNDSISIQRTTTFEHKQEIPSWL